MCRFELSLTPMLINAMITRIERENMIELSGIGVPIVLTCTMLVHCFTLS
jgi:hypothetical protein